MALDPEECYRAICARDPRYDGRFFICVHTTGIFCRPICPARTLLRKNVQFVEAAEAAIQLGFRACKRCRPEVKSGSPAWELTGASLRRALRMIDAGALDELTMDDFAAQLGIGARHLRRLVKTALGLAPNRLALARRAAFARSLIETSQLSMIDIAGASGFGSLRRFNDVVQQEFGASPTQLRSQQSPPTQGSGLTLRLRARGPLDWRSLHSFFAARAIDKMECAQGDRYSRALRVNGQIYGIALSPAPDQAIEVMVAGSKIADLYAITSRVRRALDLPTDIEHVAKMLGADRVLARAMARVSPLRLPGAWDPFELGLRAILGQQISVKAARTLAARLVARFGEPLPDPVQVPSVSRAFPTPEALSKAKVEDVVALGLTVARARTIMSFAYASATDPNLFAATPSLDALIERLCALDGIGPWTAHYMALRAFGEPDAFPASDLGLRKAYGALTGTVPTARELEAISARWSPWRGYAAQHLWNVLARTQQKEAQHELAA